MRHIFLLGLLAAMSASASASTSEAWGALYSATSKACLQKSGFKNPRVVEGPVLFSTNIHYRIRGTWPQPHMKGKTGKVYCLHPYPNGEPEIVEAR
jgi:hypothetical protein